MERYLFIRDFKIQKDGEQVGLIARRSILHMDRESYRLYDVHGVDITEYYPGSLVDVFDDMRICMLLLDADLLKTAFNSFAYTNWLNEKKADIDDRGDPLYQGLYKSPETIIMYLMEMGVSADTLLRCIYGPGNKYMEYKYIVQEFGKIL